MAIGIDGFDIYTKFHAKNYDGPNGIKKKLETLEKKIAELDGKTINIKFKLDTSSLSAVKKAIKRAFNDIDIDLTGAVKRGVRKSRAKSGENLPAQYPNYEIRAYKRRGSGWTRRNADYPADRPFEDFKGYYLGYKAGVPSRIYEGMRRSGYAEADYSTVWEGETEYFDTRGEKIRPIAGLLNRSYHQVDADYVSDWDGETEYFTTQKKVRPIAGLLGRYSTADAIYTDFADINFFNDQMFKAWRYANTKGGTAIVPVSGIRDESDFYFNDETVNRYSDKWRRKFGYREKSAQTAQVDEGPKNVSHDEFFNDLNQFYEDLGIFSKTVGSGKWFNFDIMGKLSKLKTPMLWTAIAVKGMEKLVKFVSIMSKDGLQIAQGAEALNTSASTVMGLTMAGKSMGIQNMQGSLTALQSTITGGKWGNFNSDMYRYLALLGLSYEDTERLGATGTFNKVIENARTAVISGALPQADARYFVEQILGSSGTQMFDTFSKLGITNFEEYRARMGGIATLSDEATTNLSEFSTIFSTFNQNIKTALQEGIGNSTFMQGITDSLSVLNLGLEKFSEVLSKEGFFKAIKEAYKEMNEKKNEQAKSAIASGDGLYVNLFGKDVHLQGGWFGFWNKLGALQKQSFGIPSVNPFMGVAQQGATTINNSSPVVNVYIDGNSIYETDPYAYGYSLGSGVMNRLSFSESGGFF